MPTFNGEEALHYDKRITKLVPGYELLHQLTAAQLMALYPQQAKILVVGTGTGKEIIELAKINPTWTFIAQDTSADMLAIAEQHFTKFEINSRVTLHHGPLQADEYQVDVVLCLLVMHFVSDNGDKETLFRLMGQQVKNGGYLFLADLERPLTPFEREAQLLLSKQLGLSDAGKQRMSVAFEREFYPLDKMRLAELLDNAGFKPARPYFKALGFAGYNTQKY